jgi:hypothetical protein
MEQDEFERTVAEAIRTHGARLASEEPMQRPTMPFRQSVSRGGSLRSGGISLAGVLVAALAIVGLAVFNGPRSETPGSAPTTLATLPTGGPSTPEAPNDPVAGLPYSCDGNHAFDVGLFSTPGVRPPAESGSDTVPQSVSPGAQAGWWLVYRSNSEAEYLSGTPEAGFLSVSQTIDASGASHYQRSFRCRPQYFVPNEPTLAWWLDPAAPAPKATDRAIRALAALPCELSSSAPVVQTPVIRYGSASIVVILTSQNQQPITDICQPSIIVPVTIQLDEPIGTRSLLDGIIWPGRDARRPMTGDPSDWLTPLIPHPV